jgi:hypothetical protein
MKLKEYIAHLNSIVENDSKALNMEVVYSADSEGNTFSQVYYHPSKGNFTGGQFSHTEKQANAICIN